MNSGNINPCGSCTGFPSAVVDALGTQDERKFANTATKGGFQCTC